MFPHLCSLLFFAFLRLDRPIKAGAGHSGSIHESLSGSRQGSKRRRVTLLNMLLDSWPLAIPDLVHAFAYHVEHKTSTQRL